jgi:hypothetical protein
MNRTELARKARPPLLNYWKPRAISAPVDVLVAMGKLSKANHER